MTDKASKDSRISLDNLNHNISKIDTVNTVLFITAGVIAGIFGLKGLSGFLFFAAISAFIAAAHVLGMSFQIRKYCNMNFFELSLFGMKNHAMSFVLFWILVYALVHIYKA